MKNHYIPQFIIKKFTKAINVFDISRREIREKRPSHKVFFEKGIYEDEVEKSLNVNLESTFSKLLVSKLLKEEGNIIINREEVLLIKRYMLVSSVRAQGEKNFRSFLLSFKKNTELFYKFNYRFVKSELPFTEDTKLTDRELLNNAILAYSQSQYIEDLAFNKLCTREMVAFAAPFLLSYVSFWDSPGESEFILSDVGMVSEYEGVHLLTGGLDLSKQSYLYHQLMNDKERAHIYADFLSCNTVMYENFNIFNISKTRCLLMISPFFKLYFSLNYSIYDKKYEEIGVLPEPNIWPAIIQNKDLFEPPSNKYMISPECMTMDDLFIYKPKQLSIEELIYINSLLICQSKKIIGFDSPKNIYPSVEFTIEQKSWFNSIPEDKPNISDDEMLGNYLLNGFKDPLLILALWCQKKSEDVKYLDIEKLFNDFLNNLLKDFRNNYYIFEYLLEKKEQTYNSNALDFLGKGNKKAKMKYIEKEYNRLKEKFKK